MKGKDICNQSLCSGCEACLNVCVKNAITMQHDWRGFLYPHIDSDRCTDCGLCNKICPANQVKEEFVFPESRVFIDKNKEYLYHASSGGAFGVVARFVLDNKGVVFGCSMDNDYNVKFISVDKMEDLKLLHGSKYVQSYVGHIYRDIKSVLTTGRMALFCGCPCQVAGLKKYLRKDYENLITMDLICHGVPSQPYFRAYVKDLLQKKKKMGITTFRFRYKPESCCETQHEHHSNHVHVGFHNKDYYMTYFLWGKTYRDSCYQCRYAGGKREGDFTIGDFWNNKNVRLPIDDSHGSSLILLNTWKAKSLVRLFEENGQCLPINSLEDAIGLDGGQLKHPCHNDARSNMAYALYKLFGVSGPKMLFALDNMRMGK